MSIKHRLNHLIQVAEMGHFGKAAEALRISQPALSSSILTLEKKLGVKLLNRARGAITPTAFGELVIARGKELLVVEDNLYREIDLLANHQIGALNVAFGAYPSVISGYLGIAQMMAKYPRIQISSHVKGWRDVVNSVIERQVDIGIAEISGLENHEHLNVELVGKHRGRFLCRAGHPLCVHKQATMKQLLQYPWISTRLPARIAKHLPKPIDGAGSIDPSNGDFVPAIEIDVPIFLSELLTQSNAIAPALISMAQAAYQSGKIVQLATNGFEINSEYGFITLKNRTLSPATIAFMQEIRAIEIEIAEKESLISGNL